ncbi:MAG: hypothetical protein HGB04_06515 [Chlorobiaceae bacterium]|nr:hypothetical protein [Chlorobiaceae bacterium]
MALVFCEGFDKYGSIANLERSRFYATDTAYFVNGRFNGMALKAEKFSVALGGNYDYGVLGFACSVEIDTNYPSFYLYFGQYSDADRGCVRLLFNFTTGVLTIAVSTYSGGSWGFTNVASSQPGAVTSETWYYLEVKIDKSNGVVVRVNGETPVSWSGSLSSTQSGGSFNYVSFDRTYTSANTRVRIDDMYFLNGSTGPGSRAMNDFLGDKRVVTLSPASNDSVQWTPVSEVMYASIYGDGSSVSLSGGRVYLPVYLSTSSDISTGVTTRYDASAITARQDCTLRSITIYSTTNTPGVHIRPVVYAEDPINPGNPLALAAIGNETTGIAAGENVIMFGSTAPALTKNANYWLGFFTDASIYVKYDVTANGSYQYVTATYPSAPAEYNWSGATKTGSRGLKIDYKVTATNYGMVSEDVPNHISYNTTATVGNKDLFSSDGTLPADAVVYAVQISGAFKKDDADPRYIANVVQSGSTTHEGTSTALNASFAMVTDLLVLNPDTSAEWTSTQVNAAKIGYKVTV